MCAAPTGNEYYKLRSKDGRDRIFQSPDELLTACNEYFEWVINNPLEQEELFHYQGNITRGNANKMRPMTLEGLCNYIDIAVKTFREYEKRQDFLPITTRVQQIIQNHQFEGAAAGFLNPNIIARKLGLSDKTETTGTTYTVTLSKEELKQLNEGLEKDY